MDLRIKKIVEYPPPPSPLGVLIAQLTKFPPTLHGDYVLFPNRTDDTKKHNNE